MRAAVVFTDGKKTVVLLEDDLDGSAAVETVSFAIDGVECEIDLNEAHANELRDAMKRYLSAARKSAGRGSQRRSVGDTGTKAVREWAKQNGIQVSSRGRIPADVMDKYKAAHLTSLGTTETTGSPTTVHRQQRHRLLGGEPESSVPTRGPNGPRRWRTSHPV
ncbi:histone-like nucleoid-structuring protein Lsr2 [Arthrobacter globiformis]|uniref:histone-like nucleoid-structuring protein Lsr2 n=1 Tax=Arthrobacter globiformis TaxID=1665 RepID=UPI0027D903A7|nr:Lsr2 family protein [Arthrobacter globiformis]